MLIYTMLITPAVAADLEISVAETTGQPIAALQYFDVQDVQPAPVVIDVASGRHVLEVGYRKNGKECLVSVSVHPIDEDPPAQAQANIVTRCGRPGYTQIGDVVVSFRASR